MSEKTHRVRYVGPIDAVVVAATGQECERNKTIEVSLELAYSLTEQSDWEAATKLPPQSIPQESQSDAQPSSSSPEQPSGPDKEGDR